MSNNIQRLRDMDRYRKLKQKGRVSPRAADGGASVAFSPSTMDEATATRCQEERSMMPIANPYRAAPVETPQLSSAFGCIRLSGGEEEKHPAPATAATATTNTTPKEASRQQQLTVSLFDESKRQRYEKFRSRVRSSMSPRNINNTNNPDAPGSTLNRNGGGSKEAPFDLMSHDEVSSDDKYALRKRGHHHQEPQTNDKYAFPYNRDFTTVGNKDKSRSDQRNISSSNVGSAFSTLKSSANRPQEQASHGNKTADPSPSNARMGRKFKDLPGPPSVATQTTTSSHPMNSFGLPIASAHHGPSTPQAGTKDELPSVVKLNSTTQQASNARRSTSRSRPFATTIPEPAKATADDGPRGNSMGAITYCFAASRTPSPYASRQATRSMEASSNKPPQGLPVGNRQKPDLLVNTTRSTPTSKLQPAIALADSSERGVTPPPPHSTQRTPSSFDSEGTSSTARRDRILESRGVVEQEERIESRNPLNEMRRAATDQARNLLGEKRGPAPRLESRSNLGIPSLRSTYSPRTPSQNTPLKTTTPQKNSTTKTPKNESKGVSPLDFYRRIAAERTSQAAMVKRRTGTTPTKESETSRAITPTFRAESPRCSSVPSLDQRTVRVLYSKDFDKLVREHISRHTRLVLKQTSSRRDDQSGQYGVSVYARKRPLLKDEISNGEFDVVNVEPGQAHAMIVYVTSMLSDLQTKDIQANLHEFDHVFAETRLAEDFYMRVAQEGVMRAREGGAAALVVLGTSASGKAHSMGDIEERAAYDLFETSRGTRPISVSVQYLFLTGDTVVDLLGPTGSPVRVVDDGGRFCVKGSSAKKAVGPRDLLDILSDVRRRLYRASTIRREEIAGGFIVCHISVHHTWAKGSLILLKCPSHELIAKKGGKESSMFDELMQGIRAKARGGLQSQPFHGQGNVSKIMHEMFNDHLAQISLLATISPVASSTEETLAVLDSLSSVASRSTQAKAARSRESPPPQQQENESPKSVDSAGELSLPRQWSHDELIHWMKRKNLLTKPVPPDVSGRFAMRMSKNQLKSTFYEGKDLSKAERLYMALRAENDRVARMRVKVRMARERQSTSEQYMY